MSFPCLEPNVAINLGKKSDGKMILKFISKDRQFSIEELVAKYGSDDVFILPCGDCEHCRRNYANDWAIRCVLESSEHPYNYFITLTYDEAHIQYACIEDLRKFFDRLSGHGHKNQFKFFASMERGELTERLHFHIVLFCDFEIDLKEPQWISGFYYYHSNLIDNLWTFGFHNVAPFEMDCARYVAKYTSKLKSKIIMSRNLGYAYYKKHKLDIIDDNFKLYGKFGDKNFVNIPSCFIKWFIRDCSPEIENYKSVRSAFGKFMSAYSLRSISGQHKGDDLRNLRSNLRIKKKGDL